MIIRCVAGGCALVALACMLCVPAGAVNKEPVLKPQSSNAAPREGFTTIANIPVSAEQVVLVIESAKLNIMRSATAGGITVSTNCPRNWNVKGSMVRQAGFAKKRGGVAMMADALGSRAIVNGQVYVMPEAVQGGMSLGPQGVTVGGKKLDPLQGTDLPGTCDPDAPDTVEIQVPESYKGDLLLGLGSDSAANIDSWSSGKFEATLLGTSTLAAAKLKSLSKAVLDLRGEGKAEIGELSARVLVANIVGNGKVIVKSGNADISNATVAGNGSINLNGKFGNLKKAVESGQGTINVSE
jgi:hypothetical protein